MRAVVYRGPEDIRLETVPVPQIGRHELLVKVAVCGVCPTDIKKIQHGSLKPPRIFGHETAGVIVQAGPGVKGFKLGDRVALHHHVPCLDCHACRHRSFAQCAQYKRTGVTAGFEPAGGGFAEYVRVMPFVLPGVVKIPAKNTFEEGAMLEPVNTVLKAVNRLSLLAGDAVLVAGQGPIGLMFTRLLKLRGMNVLATDLLQSRLKLARKFGARWAINPFRGQTLRDPGHASGGADLLVGLHTSRRSPNHLVSDNQSSRAELEIGGRISGSTRKPLRLASSSRSAGRVIGRRRGSAFNPQLSSFVNRFAAAVLAVPSDAALHQAMQWVRCGGQILLFAHTKRGFTTCLDLANICVDEKDLVGSYSADFTLQREVARLVFFRKLAVRKLITHRFPLEKTKEAIALASSPAADSLKVVVDQENG